MWRTKLISLAAFSIGAALVSPALALDRQDRLAPFVEGQPGGLRLQSASELPSVVPDENGFAPALRELRLSPASDPPGRLLYFTPSLTIGGATVNFGAGYGSESPLPSGDIDTARLGGGIEFGALRFGGSYEQGSGALLTDIGARQRGFDLGAAYDIGNFTTGLTWSRGIYRDFFASSSSASTQDELSLSLSYRLSRGIDLIGSLQYDQNDSTTRPDSAGSFVFGTAIRF
jgi:hypothetical protein